VGRSRSKEQLTVLTGAKNIVEQGQVLVSTHRTSRWYRNGCVGPLPLPVKHDSSVYWGHFGSVLQQLRSRKMKLEHLAIPTGVMHKGATVRDFFEEAVRCNVPGLPYVNDQGEIVGRLSIRHVYKHIAVPDSLIRVANGLGDATENIDLHEMKVIETLSLPVETYLLEHMPSVSPHSSIVKALALMELHNSGYIFLIDEGEYNGVVTRMLIADRMLRCIRDMEQNRSPSALEH
jgi:predicted transcriptional regulator